MNAPGDASTAVELLRLAGEHVDALAQRPVASEVRPVSLVGGLAASIEPWLTEASRSQLVPPVDDAVAGALQLARAAAQLELHRDLCGRGRTQ